MFLIGVFLVISSCLNYLYKMFFLCLNPGNYCRASAWPNYWHLKSLFQFQLYFLRFVSLPQPLIVLTLISDQTWQIKNIASFTLNFFPKFWTDIEEDLKLLHYDLALVLTIIFNFVSKEKTRVFFDVIFHPIKAKAKKKFKVHPGVGLGWKLFLETGSIQRKYGNIKAPSLRIESA